MRQPPEKFFDGMFRSAWENPSPVRILIALNSALSADMWFSRSLIALSRLVDASLSA
jgi:hypothetical protein